MKEGKTALWDFFGFQWYIFSWEGGNPWVEWMDQRAQGRVGRPKWLKGWSKYVHLNLPLFQPTQSLPSTNQGSKPEKIWGRWVDDISLGSTLLLWNFTTFSSLTNIMPIANILKFLLCFLMYLVFNSGPSCLFLCHICICISVTAQ